MDSNTLYIIIKKAPFSKGAFFIIILFLFHHNLDTKNDYMENA
jgi:hypothetical protein